MEAQKPEEVRPPEKKERARKLGPAALALLLLASAAVASAAVVFWRYTKQVTVVSEPLKVSILQDTIPDTLYPGQSGILEVAVQNVGNQAYTVRFYENSTFVAGVGYSSVTLEGLPYTWGAGHVLQAGATATLKVVITAEGTVESGTVTISIWAARD